MSDEGAILGGKWRVGPELGAGSMANVHFAVHRNGATAAVKILHKILSAERDLCERFLSEGYLTNQVKHPGIVRVFDDGTTDDGRPYLVMDLLEGETLESLRLRSGGSLPVPRVLDLADAILDVLATVHDAGIVHRDLKTTNVFLTNDGTLKVLDFGMARSLLARTAAKGSLVNTVVGTPSFMSPEQALGKRELVDHQSDQWGLAAILFLLLTGEPVHVAPSVEARLLAAASMKARPVRSVIPTLDPAVGDVIDRALAFKKPARFPDLRAMRVALAAARAPTSARPSGPASAPWVVEATLPLSNREGVAAAIAFAAERPPPEPSKYLVDYLPPITAPPDAHATEPSPPSSRQVEIVELPGDFPIVDLRESVPVAARTPEPPRPSLGPRELAGSLARVRLPTVLVMLEMERLDGRLTVERAGDRARLHVRAGRIVDVEPRGALQEPRDRLREVFDWSDGTFAFVADASPREDLVNASTTALVLDLAREVDEAAAPASGRALAAPGAPADVATAPYVELFSAPPPEPKTIPSPPPAADAPPPEEPPLAPPSSRPAVSVKTPFAIEPTMLTRAKDPPSRSGTKVALVAAAALVLAMVVVTATLRVGVGVGARGRAASASGGEPGPASAADAGDARRQSLKG